MFHEMLDAGGMIFWMWVLFVGTIVGGFTMAENGRPGFATVLAIVSAFIFCIITDVNPFVWSVDHPLSAIGIVLGYFAVGTAWGRIKWGFYVDSRFRKIQEIKKDFIRSNSLTIGVDGKIPEEFQEKWSTFLNLRGFAERPLRPMVSNHKAMIIAWMSYWPLSSLWTIINDPVRRAFVHIYYKVGEKFQAYSDKKFADIDTPNFNKQPEPRSPHMSRLPQ